MEEIVDSIEMLCKNPDEKFVFAYCDCPDGLLHKYGASSDEAKEFILDAENRIKELEQKLSDDTIIIISADHGHKDIEKAYTLLDYPEIQECLIMPPSLESRVVTFCPWGYYGYGPFYYVYTYPYFFYFRNVNDAPKEAPLMYKLPDDLTDICSNDTKAKVCGFDKDKKIIGDFDSMCDAGKDDDVDFTVCGKCPDKDADDKAFDLPLADDMPTCPADNNDTNNVDDTDNNTTTR